MRRMRLDSPHCTQGVYVVREDYCAVRGECTKTRSVASQQDGDPEAEAFPQRFEADQRQEGVVCTSRVGRV